MGPAVVVVALLLLCFLSDPVERLEDVGIEEFAPQAAVEALDICILCRFAGLDKGQRDFAVFTPGVKALADELWAVVHADHGRKTAAFLQLLRGPDYSAGRNAGIGLDAKHLPVVVVENIEHPKRAAILPT